MPGSKRKNGASLDKCAEIVARRQQQPNRQGGCRESVRNDGESERNATQVNTRDQEGESATHCPATTQKSDERVLSDSIFASCARPRPRSFNPMGVALVLFCGCRRAVGR